MKVTIVPCSFFPLHSKVPIDFSWDVPDGFEISPAFASLSPKQTCSQTATFKPSSAVVYSVSAVCVFSSELDKVGGGALDKEPENDHVKRKLMKLEGIGKYPHVTVKLCSGKKATLTQSKKGEGVVSDITAVSTLTNGLPICDETVAGGQDVCNSVNETVVDFGAVAVGSLAKKKIEITNVSPVSVYVCNQEHFVRFIKFPNSMHIWCVYTLL